MRISIIGIGRLGGALALALAEKGFEIENLFARKRETAERIASLTNSKILSDDEFEKISSEIILITTQDAEIPNVAENLAKTLKVKTDCSAYERFAFVGRFTQIKRNRLSDGSLHPLVSISDAFLGKTRFKNAFFCVEGDEKAVEAAEKIVSQTRRKIFFNRNEI